MRIANKLKFVSFLNKLQVRMFYCNFCNFGTPYLKKHLDHHIYHRNITYFYYCGYDRCKKCFQSGTYLRAHLRRTHGLHSKKHETFLSIAFSADERGKFVCTINICKKEFDNFHLLIKHLKKHINKNQQIQCPFRNCKRRYSVLSSFTSHISKIHKNRYDQAEIVTVENPVVESEESLNNTLLEIDDQPNMIVQHEPYNAQYDADESDLFLKNVGQFYLKLESKLLLPASTIQYIVTEINYIHEKGQEIVQQKLQESFLAEKISSDKINQIMKNVFKSDPWIKSNNIFQTDYNIYIKIFLKKSLITSIQSLLKSIK